jgi:hypothetical protein
MKTLRTLSGSTFGDDSVTGRNGPLMSWHEMQSEKWIVRDEEAVRRQAQAGNSRSISIYWVVNLTIGRLVTEEHSTSE